MEVGGLAAVFTQMQQNKLMQNVGLAVIGKDKGQAEAQGQQLVQMLQSAQPHLGANLDIKI